MRHDANSAPSGDVFCLPQTGARLVKQVAGLPLFPPAEPPQGWCAQPPPPFPHHPSPGVDSVSPAVFRASPVPTSLKNSRTHLHFTRRRLISSRGCLNNSRRQVSNRRGRLNFSQQRANNSQRRPNFTQRRLKSSRQLPEPAQSRPKPTSLAPIGGEGRGEEAGRYSARAMQFPSISHLLPPIT
jgi:hypothetical protein